MNIVKGLGCTVISAVHDLNIAALYCDRLYAIKSGRVIASGSPQEILTRELIRQLYEVDTQLFTDETADCTSSINRKVWRCRYNRKEDSDEKDYHAQLPAGKSGLHRRCLLKSL